MDYYDSDGDTPKSPGLVAIASNQNNKFPTFAATPLWLSEDTYGCPISLTDSDDAPFGYVDRTMSDYGKFEASKEYARFGDTLLLHHMAPDRPDLTLWLGSAPISSDTESDDGLSDILYDWKQARRSKRRSLKRLRKKHDKVENSKRDDLPIFRIVGTAASTAPQPWVYRSALPPVERLIPRILHGSRYDLPLTFNTPYGPEPMVTCPDTGSDVNIIPESTARRLGYTTSDFNPTEVSLRLPRGRLVEPIGELKISFWFGRHLEPNGKLETTTFYVLPGARMIFIGVAVLDETKTMTKHRNRLTQVPRANLGISSVCSVGKTRFQVVCDIDHGLTVALADTGSDVDLISPEFAQDRNLEIHPSEHVIELADGSHVVSYGFVRTTVSIGIHLDSTEAPLSKASISVDCFVLEDLGHDVILGEQSLDQLHVFTENQHVLFLASDINADTESNRVHILGKTISWIKKNLNPATSQINTNDLGYEVAGLDDQRENARLEREAAPVTTQANTNSATNTPSIPPSTTSAPRLIQLPPTPSFECSFPGCQEAPFPAKYLLTQHSKKHQKPSLYHCSVEGCRRSQGAEGFKDRDAMIRHLLRCNAASSQS